MLQELGSFPICQRKNRFKCENVHSQLRYRASAIPTIGTLTPERDYNEGKKLDATNSMSVSL
jgi:hypothetical protein